jgi:hypothetical protein
MCGKVEDPRFLPWRLRVSDENQREMRIWNQYLHGGRERGSTSLMRILIVVLMVVFTCWPRLVISTCCVNFYLDTVPNDVVERRCDIKIRSNEYWNRNKQWKISLRFNGSLIGSVGKGWSQGTAECIEDTSTSLGYICTGEWSPEFKYSFMLIRNNVTGWIMENNSYYLQASAYEESCENRLTNNCPEYADSRPTEEPKSSEIRIPGTGVSVKKTILIVCVSVGTACLAIAVMVVMISKRRKNARLANAEAEWQMGSQEKLQPIVTIGSESTLATLSKSVL